MGFYRKKPIVIEAYQLGQDYDADCAIVGWCGGRAVEASDALLEIDTLEGVMKADIGDWVVKGIAGEFYPVAPEIFEATYDSVAPPEVHGEDTTRGDFS